MPDRALTSRLIVAAAREHLRPLGLRQQGRSRLWFDDQGWWLTSVEFTPSRADGTYLVVAATWLWHQHPAWTFDDGGRVFWRDDGKFRADPPLGEPGWTDFLRFIWADQFTSDVAMLADIAAQRVAQLRTQFPDPLVTARSLASRPTRLGESPLWHAYNTAAAAGLAGDAETARTAFGHATSADRLEYDWEQDLDRQVRHMIDLATRPAKLQQHLVELIQATRQRFRLPPADLDRLMTLGTDRSSGPEPG